MPQSAECVCAAVKELPVSPLSNVRLAQTYIFVMFLVKPASVHRWLPCLCTSAVRALLPLACCLQSFVIQFAVNMYSYVIMVLVTLFGRRFISTVLDLLYFASQNQRFHLIYTILFYLGDIMAVSRNVLVR